MPRRNTPAPVGIGLLLLAACATFATACDDGSTVAAADAGPAPVTWHGAIAPIVVRACAACHVEGGVAPFPLDSFEAVRPLAAVALDAIEAGRMPPWMPDPDCRDYEDARLLTAEEKALIRAWVEAETPEGDPAAAAPIERPTPDVIEPTHRAMPMAAFTPDEGLTDDYRCFILDLEFDEMAFMTASAVTPDAEAIVHHVLVYALTPDQLGPALAADAESEAEGYPCFGSPLPEDTGDVAGFGRRSLPTQVGSWVPGANVNRLPPDHAVPIVAGSRLVMQVHYNFAGSAAEPDATSFDMVLTDVPPLFESIQRPVLVRDLDIPAGEAEAINRARFVNYGDQALSVTAVGPHMHVLGARLSSTVERVDGTEECLIDIPRWLYTWQQGFVLPPDEWAIIAPGDAITLECVFDNSAANQPFVDGAQIEPRDVGWGEGTADEMCMNYLTLSRPYVPPTPPIDGCAPEVADCVETCRGERSTADCIFACGGDPQCTQCAVQQTPDCGGAVCAGPLLAFRDQPCLQDCFVAVTMLGGEPTVCFREQCAEHYEAVTTCLTDVFDSGACDAAVADVCGLALTR